LNKNLFLSEIYPEIFIVEIATRSCFKMGQKKGKANRSVYKGNEVDNELCWAVGIWGKVLQYFLYFCIY
jgi:hypothetical protein